MPIVLALPDLLLIVGIAALLLMANATKGAFVKPLADLLSAVPVIGGQLADIVSNGWDQVVAGLQQNLNDAVHLLTAALDLVHGAYQLVLNGATTTAEWLGIQTSQAIGGLADLGAWANAQLGNLVSSVLAATKAAADALVAAQHAAQQVQGLIQGGINDIVTQALHDYQTTVNGFIQAALAPVRANIHRINGKVDDYHSIEVATREHEVGQLRGAIDDTKAQLNTRIHGVEGDVAALDTRAGSIEADVTGILGEIGTVAAGTTLVGLITKVATSLETLDRECVTPSCDFLGPQLGILNALEDTATLALVAGMVAAAANQPRQAAGSGIDVVGGLLGPVFGLFHEVTGVSIQ